ncbi:MAG: aminotransferase class V-fold PLP-dependent enzyme [Candidatus Dormibacteraeota bacterium]|nr:aminotransferase class V-fold PLP-dependent enzyme [Candidatus Dormibacteraeota bacterium]
MRHAFGADFDVPLGYLDTASIGVPSVAVADAVVEAVDHWRRAEQGPFEHDAAVERAREAFAGLIGVPAGQVAIGATVSQLLAPVAAGLPDGARVVTLEREYTSVTFPFAAHAGRGVTVAEVPRDQLYDRVAGHDVVAISLVQSADGWTVDPDRLRQAAQAAGALVVLDASQAVGWLPLRLDWADFVAVHGYKWLFSPRGAAWLSVHPRAAERGLPVAAGWYAAQPPADPAYGLPLRLRAGARRFDLSPAWISQAGAAEALPYLAGLDLECVHRHNVGLADRFLCGLGLEPRGQAIVSVDADQERLRAARVVAPLRDGRTRFSFHLYNTEADVERALEALA